jgi:hypothetical protein
MMRIAIMQPYFFPYLGYFSLMKHTDMWIVFDVVQFIRHGWIERNRVLKHGEGWQYISVPLEKHSRDILIKDVSIRSTDEWQETILRQLEHYKKKAPFYRETTEFLNEAFSFCTESITKLDAHLLKMTCEYLGLNVKMSVFSEISLDIEPVTAPGDWALNISKAMKADGYINPPGAKELFDREKFSEAGISLGFLEIQLKDYDQKRSPFEPGLSIIDAMMFNSKEEINKMLDDFSLV